MMPGHNDFKRYRKQLLVNGIGIEGQKSLSKSSILVAGCGGLGTCITDNLVRAGIGNIKIVDPDFVEESNLHRQVLYTEEDARKKVLKVVAAEKKLKKINSRINIEGISTDINNRNVEDLVKGTDLVLDATDNFKTRFLINETCVKEDIPWIYGGVLATYGSVYLTIPGKTACFRCFNPDSIPPGDIPTCETMGILGSAVNIIAAVQVVEAIKYLCGQWESLAGGIININVWNGSWDVVNIGKSSENKCPVCDLGRYEYLAP